jgi:hypothetical protein
VFNLGRPAISNDIKEEILERLNKHVEEKYIGQYGVKDVIARFKGRYLYIDWIEGLTNEETQELIEAFRGEVDDAEKVEKFESLIHLQVKRSERKPSKLCRLRYTGDINSWDFEIYKYSDNWYDTEGEFPFASGTVEECFDATASLYITQTYP